MSESTTIEKILYEMKLMNKLIAMLIYRQHNAGLTEGMVEVLDKVIYER